MVLTVRMLGLELLHIEVTDQDDGGYDHDVVSTSIDADPEDGALGFVPPSVVGVE